MNKPKIWRVLSESPEDLLNKMRNEFLPNIPKISGLSEQEIALFKKYTENWAVQAFSDSKKHSGVLFYSGEFKEFIFDNDVMSAIPNDIVNYVYSKYTIDKLAADGKISWGSYGSIEGLRKAVSEFWEIDPNLGQEYEQELIKSLIAASLSNIVICEIDIEKNSMPLNKAEKALRNDLIKIGIPGDDLEKLSQEMQALKLDIQEKSTFIDKKKKIQKFKKGR